MPDLVLDSVPVRKKIKHIGNLVINNDVNNYANITVTNGYILIKGSVRNRVSITQVFSSDDDDSQLHVDRDRVTICGDVGNDVDISSYSTIDLRGLGHRCHVVSSHGSFMSNKVGHLSFVSARQAIHSGYVDTSTRLQSLNGLVSGISLLSDCSVSASKDICFNTIGINCKLDCENGTVRIGSVGDGSRLIAKLSVYVNIASKSAKLISHDERVVVFQYVEPTNDNRNPLSAVTRSNIERPYGLPGATLFLPIELRLNSHSADQSGKKLVK